MINLWAAIYFCAVLWAPIPTRRLPGTAVNAGRWSKAKDKICGEPGSREPRMTSPTPSSARSSQLQPQRSQLLKGCEEGTTGMYKEAGNSQTLLFIYLLSKLTSR